MDEQTILDIKIDVFGEVNIETVDKDMLIVASYLAGTNAGLEKAIRLLRSEGDTDEG